jgi:TPP-dependent 2-oxoacid decarboxylase
MVDGAFALIKRALSCVLLQFCYVLIRIVENCVAETERLIAAALYHRRPVYMAFPTDHAITPGCDDGIPHRAVVSSRPSAPLRTIGAL